LATPRSAMDKEAKESTTPRSVMDEEMEEPTTPWLERVQTLSTTHQEKLVLPTLSNTKAHKIIDIHKK